MFYAIIGDLTGVKIDLNDNIKVDKIMRDLGYNDSDYTISAKDIAEVASSDVILVLSIYSLGASAETAGTYAVLFESKASGMGTIATGASIVFDVVFTPHINFFTKFSNYLEKKNLENTLKNCKTTSEGRYDIACINYIGIGTSNIWESWITNGYVYKFNSYYDILDTELIDPSNICEIEELFGWT